MGLLHQVLTEDHPGQLPRPTSNLPALQGDLLCLSPSVQQEQTPGLPVLSTFLPLQHLIARVLHGAVPLLGHVLPSRLCLWPRMRHLNVTPSVLSNDASPATHPASGAASALLSPLQPLPHCAFIDSAPESMRAAGLSAQRVPPRSLQSLSSMFWKSAISFPGVWPLRGRGGDDCSGSPSFDSQHL